MKLYIHSNADNEMNNDFLYHYTNFQLSTHQITEASVITQKPVHIM